MPILLEILDEVPLVADLPGDEKAALAPRCTLRTYRPAQDIISNENDARDVYFITSGAGRVVNW